MIQNTFDLYKYVSKKYHNYKGISYNEYDVIVIFHYDFELRIRLDGLFKIYFNNYLYYDVDLQDIELTVDDFFSNQFVFCLHKNRIKIIRKDELIDDEKFVHIWTIEKTIK